MKSIEHQHAVALVQWWFVFARSNGIDERVLFAIPNGGHRHIAVASKMKAEGVRAGVPDYFLAIPKHPHGGLFIELKTEKGSTSKNQKEMIGLLLKNFYSCVVCRGWGEAKDVIENWIKK